MFERSGGMAALASILRDRLDTIKDENIENKAYWVRILQSQITVITTAW